jgi:hypothetical protein
MLIKSRRLSWMLLAFSFFLFLAPAFLSPPINAQEALPGDGRSLVPMIIQWGMGGVMFTVWLYQFRKTSKGDETVVALLTKHLEDSNKITTLAFEKYDKHIDALLQLQKDSQDHTSLLTGALSRLDEKLSKPVMCPLLDRRERIRSQEA